MKAITPDTVCFICDLWGIERQAKHVGVFDDGQMVPVCDNCKQSGFRTIDTTVTESKDEDPIFMVMGTNGRERTKYMTHGIAKTATLNNVIRDFIARGIVITGIVECDEGQTDTIEGERLHRWVIDAMQ